jgi:hypothetical protein
VYSTTNVTFGSDAVHRALSGWLEIWGSPGAPAGVRVTVYDLIPVTADMLPPVDSWPLLTNAPAMANAVQVPGRDQRRFFAATIYDTKLKLETKRSDYYRQ